MGLGKIEAALFGTRICATCRRDREGSGSLRCLGLLKPRRSEAGYRVYAPQDLERLEQIVALKFIGIPLAEIKRLLERDALGMAQALRLRGPGRIIEAGL